VAQGEAPAITNEYAASLRVVDAHPQAPVQPGVIFRRTAVRGIPFAVRDRWATAVRSAPILSAEYWIVTGPDATTRLSQ
jgi:hypothetical protein